MNRMIWCLTLCLSIMACNETSDGEGSSSQIDDNHSQEQALVVTGEIGVELGDSNYVFGVIEDVDIAHDGRIAVLDSQQKKVMVYSPEGNFLGSFGGTGEAPGEFLNPRSVAWLSDGRIAVSDPFSREVEIFNEDFSHSETVTSFTERAPFVITATEIGFAGEQGGFNRDEGTVSQRILSWNLETDSIHTLMDVESRFSTDNLAARFMEPQAGIAFAGGSILFAPPVTEEYRVQVYPLDGSEGEPLTFPDYTPVSRSQQEIDEEMQEFEDRIQAMMASGRGSRFADVEYAPPRDYYAITALGVDSEGTVWVRRGWESTPIFDLFLPGETTPSSTISAVTDEEDISSFDFVIASGGFAAFERDPEYYPRVLLLELQNN